MQSIIYVGMDVHSQTVSLAATRGGKSNVIARAEVRTDVREIDKWLKKLANQLLESTGEIVAFELGYEAGCLGFWPYRELKSKGYGVSVLAPSTLSVTAKERANKTDRLDAEMIARNLSQGTASVINVPSEEMESIRDYFRTARDLKSHEKQCRQRIISFCARKGKIYRADAGPKAQYWTSAHRSWLDSLEFATGLDKESMDELLGELSELESRLSRMEEKLSGIADKAEYSGFCSKAACVVGLTKVGALAILCEVCDFRRFPSAKAFMAYLGLTPGSHSSGQKDVRTGITKQGNSFVRCLLVECCWSYSRWTGKKTKALAAKQSGVDAAAVNWADAASRRLRNRYWSLLAKGKPKNKALTALAREMSGFVWALGCECASSGLDLPHA